MPHDESVALHSANVAKLTKLNERMKKGISEEDHAKAIEEMEKKYMGYVASEGRLREAAESRERDAKETLESVVRSLADQKKSFDEINAHLIAERTAHQATKQSLQTLQEELGNLQTQADDLHAQLKSRAKPVDSGMQDTIHRLTSEIGRLERLITQQNGEINVLKSTPVVKKSFNGFDLQVTGRDGMGAITSISVKPKE